MSVSLNGATPADPQPEPLDRSNTLLQPTAAQMMTATQALPDGRVILLVTIRTASTTTTVFLEREVALDWARLLRNTAQGITSLHLPPGASQG